MHIKENKFKSCFMLAVKKFSINLIFKFFVSLKRWFFFKKKEKNTLLVVMAVVARVSNVRGIQFGIKYN